MSGIIRVEKNKNYSVVSNVCLRDDNMSMKAKGLYAYLLTLPDDWIIYQQELLGHFTDGRSAIAAAMDELESHGYMHKQRTRGDDGRMSGWDYTLYEHPQVPDDQVSPPKSDFPKSVFPKSDNQQLLNTDIKLNTNNTKPPDGFDAFWNAYPNKKGKQAALKAYTKNKKHLPENVLAILEAHKRQEQWTKDGGQFIPHASTWLNNHRWEDEIGTKTSTAKVNWL